MPCPMEPSKLAKLVARLEHLQAPKAFVAAVVLVNFAGNMGNFPKELQYLEVFAGVANVWRAVSSTYPAARVDLTYCAEDPNFKQNPMNILSSAGFATCIWLCLQASPEDFFGLLAIVCGSWVPVNIATSKRSIAFATGDLRLSYVNEANSMCERVVLLAVLICALGGTFFIEQPGGSYMEYYDKMEWLYARLPVYKVAWWMGHYGHSSPKRHKAFTNNRWCAKFNLGKLNYKKFKASQDPNEEKPTRRYVDSKGKARYVGTKKLKSTQVYPVRFGYKTLELMPKLKSRGEGMPELPQEDSLDGPKLFNDMSWNDEMNWDHARLKPLVVYLRGNSFLKLPPEWKAVFPKHF